MKASRVRWLPSVRMRATLAAVLVVGAALGVGTLVVTSTLAASLKGAVDEAARLRVEAVANLAAGGTLPAQLAVPSGDTAFVQVINARGHVVAASSNVVQQGALVHLAGASSIHIRTVNNLPIGDQGAFRVGYQLVDTPSGPFLIVAAVSLGPTSTTLDRVTSVMLAGLAGLLGVVGVMAWLLAGRALAPVEAIRRCVTEISSADMDRRVPDPGGCDEIARLARTMNDMLTRLEDSHRRQRRFVANASHELRSPLTSALVQVEVDLAHMATADWPATAVRVHAELERMRLLIADLLELASADGGAQGQHRESVDLDDVVQAEASRRRATSPVILDTSAVSAVRIQGNRRELGRVVANLIDNAIRHARRRVEIRLASDQGTAELVVADDGSGISADERERIFERFVRLDESRTRDEGGTGLGLAIVREVVLAYGGTITIDDAAPGARFLLRLPMDAVPGAVTTTSRHVRGQRVRAPR